MLKKIRRPEEPSTGHVADSSGCSAYIIISDPQPQLFPSVPEERSVLFLAPEYLTQELQRSRSAPRLRSSASTAWGCHCPEPFSRWVVNALINIHRKRCPGPTVVTD